MRHSIATVSLSGSLDEKLRAIAAHRGAETGYWQSCPPAIWEERQ
jgi:hypothetical protein